MRRCGQCKAEDRAEIDNEAKCSCGAANAGSEDHRPECNRFVHSVRLYVVRVPRSELTMDKQLSSYYTSQGWALKVDGERFYRSKMLCRACIREHVGALERKKDYQRACKAARGLDDKTYAQMLAHQSF